MAKQELSAAEVVFLKRALPHFLSGKSVADSMRAVLADDARIITAAFDRASTDYFPTPCERGRSVARAERAGDLIAHEIASAVHARLNDRVPA